MHIIAGLGNPGEEYAETRHNAGRIAVELFASKNGFDTPSSSKKIPALVATGEIGKGKKAEKVTVVLPETFMNKSGKALEPLVTSVKKAEKLIVVHDDLDMPLGRIKILFNRGSGGHKGIESIQRSLKTEAFARIKIGICPTTPTGKMKKPSSDKMPDFVVGPFKPAEYDEMKKVAKKVAEALETIVLEGRPAAMNEFNK
jgi:peptidyl-tRNA hydrolase, PTH1 family